MTGFSTRRDLATHTAKVAFYVSVPMTGFSTRRALVNKDIPETSNGFSPDDGI